jgi:ABC-type multidrug transport system ATPase subunit
MAAAPPFDDGKHNDPEEDAEEDKNEQEHLLDGSYSLSFEDISIGVKRGARAPKCVQRCCSGESKWLLNHVSGRFVPGDVVAIMGTSGASAHPRVAVTGGGRWM